jgi:hypothetical protein
MLNVIVRQLTEDTIVTALQQAHDGSHQVYYIEMIAGAVRPSVGAEALSTTQELLRNV